MTRLFLAATGRTDVGLQRDNNEDSYFIGDRTLVVADGVGGSVAGELASETVVDVFTRLTLPDDNDDEDLGGALVDAAAEGNRAIRDLVQRRPELSGMGTTLTAAAWAGRRIVFAQVGDSRAYYLPARGPRTMTQITRDDSFVQYLVDRGKITAEQAAVHPRRNVILQALDGTPVTPALTVMALVPGDRYLLCSDGLSDYVPREAVEAVLRDIADRDEAADATIDLALEAGAPDNVTVIVADVQERADEQPAQQHQP